MATATKVPETRSLSGRDARAALGRIGFGPLAAHAFARFRRADGFTHARALGYQLTLTAIPGLISAVGLATMLGEKGLRALLQHSLQNLAPGAVGQVLTKAFQQGSSGGSSAFWIGLGAALLSGTIAMALVERGANRMYGLQEDRRPMDKYRVAFVLAWSAGLLLLAAFLLFVAGSAIERAGADAGWSEGLSTTWRVVRWPAGLVLVVAAFALLFRASPGRKQPRTSWLAFGSGVAVALWLVFTLGLAGYLTLSKSWGDTYGLLSGVMGLLAWAYLSSLALFVGFAFAAELEAIHAGEPGTLRRDERGR